MTRYHSWPAAKAAGRRIGCDYETLRWYAAEGRIATRTRRGATVYRPADVERIARERASAALRARAPLPGDLIARLIK